IEAVAGARGADGVELVDEDDRGRVLPRFLEQLANSRGAEAGEHLDERRGALQVKARSGFARDRLGEERLAGPGWAVEKDALGDTCAELLEAPRIAQEVHDLSELLLRLLEPGHVRPGDLRLCRDRLRGGDARHH